MNTQPNLASEPAAAMDGPLVLSIVTSALNEGGNVRPFLEEALLALARLDVPGEILFIDDGSSDATAQVVADFARHCDDAPIRLVRHPEPRGLAAAINEGAALARGRFICFVPADLESLPSDDIPKLFHAMDDKTGAVLGRRVGRGDNKHLASSIYNRLNASLFGVRVQDGNWIKLIRREYLAGIQLRKDWHSFLVPILAHGGCRFKEVETLWRRRKHGRSKFGLKRFPAAAKAALSVKWHLTYGARPRRLFAHVAIGLASASVLLLLASIILAPPNGQLGIGARRFSTAFLIAGCITAAAGLLINVVSNRRADK